MPAASPSPSELRVLRLEDDAWQQALAGFSTFDVYHLPEYHRLAEQRGEGWAFALIYQWDGCDILLPLLLRPVAEIPGLADVADRDATSAYGYVGPIASHAEIPPAICSAFTEATRAWLLGQGVVSVFSRLHPLLDQTPLLAGAGTIQTVGPTVSIDLKVDPEQIWQQYRSNHRRDIRKLTKRGVVVEHDRDWQGLDAFARIYRQTMTRVGAGAGYFFEDAYFEAIRDTMGAHYDLFLARLEGEVICAGLFSSCRGIVQYHLGGTTTAHLALAPMKLVFDQVRHWAAEQGATHLHLGGGVGSREDELFRFKRGFSERTHAFQVWQWVLDPARYAELCARTFGDDEATGSGFFPRYRDPAGRGAGAERA